MPSHATFLTAAAAAERAFTEMMIKHHTMAIKEGQQCLDRAYHEALIDAP